VKSVYLDFAAATPLAKEVKSAMAPFFDKNYANPSALYAPAVKAREAVEAARELLQRIREGRDDAGAYYRSCTANAAWMTFFATHPELFLSE
jgi:cysteine sulfinate desulfinase/cysteine desulfurase-like protein